jgi:hypothetical protein
LELSSSDIPKKRGNVNKSVLNIPEKKNRGTTMPVSLLGKEANIEVVEWLASRKTKARSISPRGENNPKCRSLTQPLQGGELLRKP